MKFSDLTTVSKVAIGLAVAAFVLSFQLYSTSNAGGVYTCSFIDYGKVIFGGLAIVVGGLGEVSALRMGEARTANLLASGGASVAGIIAVLMGLGIIGGPC